MGALELSHVGAQAVDRRAERDHSQDVGAIGDLGQQVGLIQLVDQSLMYMADV